MPNLLTQSALSDALDLTDLTDSRRGSHAMQLLIDDIHTALADHWQCRRQVVRQCPVVPIENNYDRLGYPPDGAARDERYTRYITDRLILRTQTSSAIPDLLAGLSLDPPDDLLLILPGLVYRRDSIDRLHCGEPHQLDLWRIVSTRSGQAMTHNDLQQMIAVVMQTALPGLEWRISESPHPYTEQGVQIDAYWHDKWIEVGECGIASRKILADAKLRNQTGLAMGLGLDRLLMLRKHIPDIRLLRSSDARVSEQMNDLDRYRPVSIMPAISRDLSLCIDRSTDEEELGGKIREGLTDVSCIESVEILSETAYGDLPASAHERMGMRPEHKNVLLQLTIRHNDRTITNEEANSIRNRVYSMLHQGDRCELIDDDLAE